MRYRKAKHKLKKNSTGGKSLVYIFSFIFIMAFVTWFFLPDFKSFVNGQTSPFDKTLKYIPTPTPKIIEQEQKEREQKVQEQKEEIVTDIADAVSTVAPEPVSIDGYIADANSYKSDNVEVEIEVVSENDITYYVADVKIKDMSDITSATYYKLNTKVVRKPATDIAQKYDAVISINTDFYTYKNRGYIIRNGVAMLNNGYRDFLCLFDTGEMDVFKQSDFTIKELIAKGAMETFEFGPILIRDGQIDEVVYSNTGQYQTKHPRCGVGYYNEGHYLFIVVDGRKEGYSVGVTVPEFAQIFENYGVELAYNLDGGGSATMTFMGELVNKPEGNDLQRKIDNILYIKDTEYKYDK